MATRSRIAMKQSTGDYLSVYCHWDGSPQVVGRILRDHYQDPKKVESLLSLGNISSLGTQIGEKHPFEKCPEGMTNFYGRDREEEGQEAVVDRTLYHLYQEARNSGGEYLYVFQDGKWMYTPVNDGIQASTIQLFDLLLS